MYQKRLKLWQFTPYSLKNTEAIKGIKKCAKMAGFRLAGIQNIAAPTE